MHNRTIVALATPEGVGGLAVVRLSGPEAVAVARRVFRSRRFAAGPVSHTVAHGVLHHPDDGDRAIDRCLALTLLAPRSYTGEDTVEFHLHGGRAVARRVFRSGRFAAGPVSHTVVHGLLHHPDDTSRGIDRCLALTLLAPRSYTGEDTVEFHLHGGRAVARLALAACRSAGALPAAPGEFTRRAFLHGKLSLDQAEAVADLIAADSEQAARGALNQLHGGLARELAAVEAPLLDLLARIEGSFEFLDEDEVAVPAGAVAAELAVAVAGIDRLLAMAPAGRLLRDGVQVVLSGPVNAGKSALFNALVGDERAIVDAEPGTTRDVVSARVVRGGAVYVLHDTAGARPDAGPVESKGIARMRRQVESADLVLAVADDGAPGPSAPGVLAVRTKADLGADGVAGFAAVTSAVTGAGIAELWGAIEAQVESLQLGQAVALGVVLNERHAARLGECRAELAELGALAAADSGAGAEILGTMLASILGRLGEVSGRVFSEQLLNTVFSKFCVGK